MLRQLYLERVETGTALVCLTVAALLGIGLGISNTEPVQTPENGPLGINVDRADLQRVVFRTHRGLATNWGSFSGKPRVVFFGYTFCPDICPMGLSNVAGALDILDAEGFELQPIFVTIDPKRDTVEVLKDYVPVFHERLEGLTGKEQGIEKLASAFLAHFEVNNETAGDEYYLIDHTSFVYLVSETGDLLGYYPESTSPNDLAQRFQADMAPPTVALNERE